VLDDGRPENSKKPNILKTMSEMRVISKKGVVELKRKIKKERREKKEKEEAAEAARKAKEETLDSLSELDDTVHL